MNAEWLGTTAVRNIWAVYLLSAKGHNVEYQTPPALIFQEGWLCFRA